MLTTIIIYENRSLTLAYNQMYIIIYFEKAVINTIYKFLRIWRRYIRLLIINQTTVPDCELKKLSLGLFCLQTM